MKLVTAAQMREIDRRTIEAGFVPSLALMENAGRRVASQAAAMLDAIATARVEVVCGKGNNGGDGFVAARQLAAEGARVRVHRTHAPEDLSPDARHHYERLAEAGVEDALLPQMDALDGRLASALRDADLCIDALLGTGVERRLEGRWAALVDVMNACSRRILAVDVPSGIDATSGAVLGTAVRAHCTVTLGLPKLGLVVHPGREHAGQLVVVDIGFPAAIVDAVDTLWSWFDATAARAFLPRLDPTAYKYTRGSVLVIAGSRAYPGAAALAAEAAQRAGAGMVHLVSVESNRTILETRLREVIVHTVPETPAGTCSAALLDFVAPWVARADAVALGPGLGTAPETLETVRQLLVELEIPAVVDADALRALPPPPHAAPRILTPHTGELARLLERNVADVRTSRADAAADAAREHGAVVLAKGAPTFVVDPTGSRLVNATGNVGLASGGTGDVLTGIIGGLLAQGVAAAGAAGLGAYLHGAAADALVASSSPRSLIAGDLPAALGAAFRDLEHT